MLMSVETGVTLIGQYRPIISAICYISLTLTKKYTLRHEKVKGTVHRKIKNTLFWRYQSYRFLPSQNNGTKRCSKLNSSVSLQTS